MADLYQRTTIPDFALYNPAYSLAKVSAYTIDANGDKTSTLATLYAGISGSATLENPQNLTSDGRWAAPVYVDEPVILEITELDSFGTHDTGVIYPRTNPEFLDQAELSATRAIIFAREAQSAAERAERAQTSFATDYLEKVNNLSDVQSASAARTNLGLVINSDVQAYNEAIEPAIDLYLLHNFA